jgi:apolipoprotein N-acyltransferase
VQVADVVGARGVTLLLVTANVALAGAVRGRDNPRRAVGLAGGVAAGAVAALGYGIVRERTLEVRTLGQAAMVQPNVAFDRKNERDNHDDIVRSLLALSDCAVRETDPDLMVWPESAVPDYLFRHPSWDRMIAAHAVLHRVPIVTGGIHVVWGETRDAYDYYNSAFLYDALGRRDPYPVYHKRYLVPMVERLPYLDPRWLNLRWFGGFSVGAPGEIYETASGRFGVLVCYESAFEDLTRRYRGQGADFVVNVTNDAWFGRTSAPYQHLAHLVMRAIENRVGIARAANSGISGVVDPLGRVRGATALETQTFTSAPLLTTDVMTLYTRLGDWVGLLAVAFTVGFVGFAWWKRT